jgi:hypothetical protein
VNLTLATQACGGTGGGGGRSSNARERDVFDVWNSQR